MKKRPIVKKKTREQRSIRLGQKRPHTLRGKVVSDKMHKTIVVEIQRSRQHPIYKKIYLISSKIKAHDEKEEAKVGDLVEIETCRPISKDKHFKLKRVIK